MTKIDREELRALVRQALKDALGPGAAAATKPAVALPPTPPRVEGPGAALRKAVAEGGEMPVAARSADDLARFARMIAEASDEPSVRAAILAGKVRFMPAGGAPGAASSPAAPAAAFAMTSGVLTETRLVEIARTHRRISLGAGVVLTPLARDKAREMKIELARQKP